MFNQDKNGIFSITRGDSGFVSCIYNKETPISTVTLYDTSDATASDLDIKLGKTAYGKYGKIEGTYQPLLIAKSISENGTYSADSEGVEGYNVVEVDIHSPLPGQIVSGTVVNLTAEDLQGATEISEYKFFRDSNIRTVECPSTLTKIGQLAFSMAHIEQITLNEGITHIYSQAFSSCEQLQSIDLPESITYIGGNMCSSCKGLQHAKIGNNVSIVENSAFSYCSGLKTVDVGTGVIELYPWAFGGCSSLQYIIMRPVTPPIMSNTSSLTSTNNCLIYVPDESVNAYKTATNWTTVASRIHPISEIEE